MKKKIKIGILISGSGTNMQAIVKACERGEVNGRVVFVGSDNPNAKGLKWAKKREITTFVVDYAHFMERARQVKEEIVDITTALPNRLDYYDLLEKGKKLSPEKLITQSAKFSWFFPRILAEEELLGKMRKFDFDLLVLAGYMRVLTPYIIDQINDGFEIPRIMNIHPALLPAFPGTDGYGNTFRYGCKVGGCTVHFIDYGEDTGPIIGQKWFPIYPGDLLPDVKERGLKLEWKLFPECIQLFAEERLFITTNGKGRKIVLIGEIYNHLSV